MVRTRLAVLALALIPFAVGCSTREQHGKPAVKKGEAAHDHPETGPHSGALAEAEGEKYHAEFLADHDKKLVTVYILDGTAKKTVPIAAETVQVTLTNFKPAVQLTLKADPESGDPKGESSRFTGTHEKIAEKADYTGEISATIAGSPYIFKFEEHDHDHGPAKK